MIDLEKMDLPEQEKDALRPILRQYHIDMRRIDSTVRQSVENVRECINLLSGWEIVLRKVFADDTIKLVTENHREAQKMGAEIEADIKQNPTDRLILSQG
jgi:PIN domain nuclease of toxin-antitoxin system